MSTAEDPTSGELREGYAEVGEQRLHYMEAGEGPLIVLLHGFPEFWYGWREQIQPLAAAGFRVVAPDMRGYNLSSKPDGVHAYDTGQLTADIVGLIHERGAESALLAGHDWGGSVAWATAMDHPEVVDRLAILNAAHPRKLSQGLHHPGQLRKSWYFFFFDLPELPESVVHANHWHFFRHFLGDAHPAYTPEETERYIEAWSQPGAATGMINYYRSSVRTPPKKAEAALRPIKAPTLVIWGQDDRYLGQELADPDDDDVPGLDRVERLPDASHWVHSRRGRTRHPPAHRLFRPRSGQIERVKIMNTTHWRRAPLAACCAALAALALAAAGATAATAGTRAAASGSGGAPITTTDDGAVRGVAAGSINEFLGIPYAAPPTGSLRWRPPQPPAEWQGVRDATQFGPSCPQPPEHNATFPPGPISEDCLYLNVYTPAHSGGDLRSSDEGGRPVLVWIHGGGLTSDASRNYDPAKLAADGVVAVTINYRLGALGFLAHPALASRPGGPSGNYGLMDQQAALRWVQDNIARFGGSPHNVTIAGESAGGLSVLAHMVSAGSRGLFQKAIIESGSFALNQQPLATAEAAGEAFAAQAGCPDQTAACLRHLPVSALVNPNFIEIPGVVDGKVLTEPIGTALAAGRFARVPVLNGTNHEEEALFVAIGLTVSQGTDVPIPGGKVTLGSYQADIAVALGVTAARAAQIAAEYPPGNDDSSATAAFTTLVGDASFACPALQIDQLTAQRAPTYAYEFNDDNAPQLFTPPTFLPLVATHGSELPYLLDLPNAPFPPQFTAGQQALAASMRAAWAHFAATGNPATAAVPWPAISANSTPMLSLVPPQPQLETDFATRHHCAFWAAG